MPYASYLMLAYKAFDDWQSAFLKSFTITILFFIFFYISVSLYPLKTILFLNMLIAIVICPHEKRTAYNPDWLCIRPSWLIIVCITDISEAISQACSSKRSSKSFSKAVLMVSRASEICFLVSLILSPTSG